MTLQSLGALLAVWLEMLTSGYPDYHWVQIILGTRNLSCKEVIQADLQKVVGST